MTTKNEWKDSGRELGGAFKGLAMSLVRSVKDGAGAAEEALGGRKDTETEDSGSTVFNDGTWRETGKDLGKAFARFGETLAGTVADGVDNVCEFTEGIVSTGNNNKTVDGEVTSEEKIEE